MDIAEMIHNIETAGEGDIQEIVFAAMQRYRELYPDWEIIQYSLNKKDPKEYHRQAIQIAKMILRQGLSCCGGDGKNGYP